MSESTPQRLQLGTRMQTPLHSCSLQIVRRTANKLPQASLLVTGKYQAGSLPDILNSNLRPADHQYKCSVMSPPNPIQRRRTVRGNPGSDNQKIVKGYLMRLARGVKHNTQL
ncbi:unnamed protein product [Orchesella dallaii]|uniref:Uncharacterized protein n=1 Tax=Orchesella dallaii TaxID=48710 RepID=A0ABP1S120_9HEXA